MLDQFLQKDCNVEFAIEVDEFRDEPGFRRFGGFLAATCIHVGDYSTIVGTYIKMIQLINRNSDKYVIDGYPSDEFIISPLDINNIEEHITKVIIPIKEITTIDKTISCKQTSSKDGVCYFTRSNSIIIIVIYISRASLGLNRFTPHIF